MNLKLPPKLDTVLYVRVTADNKDRLEAISKANGVSLSVLVNALVEKALNSKGK